MTTILAGAATDTGRVRERNEDAVRLADPNAPEVAERGFLAVVADGMGGHQRGEVASNLAVETLFESIYTGPRSDDMATALKGAFRTANERIAAQATGGDPSSAPGTTLVAAALVGNQLTVANVGDSRAYLLRAEAATQITRDHSIVAEQVAGGVLTPEEARESRYRNVVTRALGHRAKLDVDVFEIGLLPEDGVVLCSDGVHGHVEPDEIADLGLRGSPEEASRRLIALALDRGSTDNVSAAVIWYEPSGALVAAPDTGRLPAGVGAGGHAFSPVLLLLVLAVLIALTLGVAFALGAFS